MSAFPWKVARPLGPAQRARVAARLAGLLRWQCDLADWPASGRGYPVGTPFVSLYANGRLTGCYGSDEGSAAERLTRAFLRALEDQRFGPVTANERTQLIAQVSYPVRVRPLKPERALDCIEVGVHGIALGRPGSPAVVLLPHVARDGVLGALGILEAAAQKAGLGRDGWKAAKLALFETDDVVSRPLSAELAEDPRGQALQWLTRLVARDGTVLFAIDGRRRELQRTGPMHHGRAAVVIAALVRERAEVRDNLWHAGQVALALGASTPAALWRATVADLEHHPWAPWTLLAARARQDGAVTLRAEAAIVASIRASSPHEGGAGVTAVPEIALTALAVESLTGSSSRVAARAAQRARRFLLRWQHRPQLRAALDPELVAGAFPASPIVDLARGDVTAHALMALGLA